MAQRLETPTAGEEFVCRVETALKAKQGAANRALWGHFLRYRLLWVIAASACVMVFVIWWQISPTPGPIALLVNEAGARFANGAAPDVVSFTRGSYQLVEGAAHLRFRNGVDVVMVGPTSFRIDDVNSLRVEEGSLRALVPEPAHGFVVSAAGVRFRDLGTEFGVTVNRSEGKAQLHVFEGQVEVLPEGSATVQATILGGQSVAVSGGIVRETPPPVEGQFLTVDSISLRRWNAHRDRLRRDPNLVFYYPFVHDASNATMLRDDAVHGEKLDGRIAGAEWVTGRWPGKMSLQFEHPGDGVALTIPGEFEQVTLAAWLKIDRLENPVNAVMNSVGAWPGSIHWQMTRKGQSGVTWFYSEPKRTNVWYHDAIPQGRWVHWAVTADRHTGKILHYLNGKPIGESRLTTATAQIKPATVHIGRWQPDNKPPEVRDFRGRIDEMAMWRVALSAKQIAKEAEAGMPVELPSVAGK